MGVKPLTSVGTGKDTEVGESESLERVELAGQTLAGAATSFGGEYRTIPEVGADIAVNGIADVKIAIAHGYILGLRVSLGR